MAYDIPPPTYCNIIQNTDHPVPLYSPVASSSEHSVLDSESTCPRSFCYKTDHLHMCLRRSIWGLKVPTYGLNAIVRGSIKFRKPCSYVVALSVSLMGCVSTSTSQNAVAVAGVMKTPLVSKKFTLLSSSSFRNYENAEESEFEFPFPEFIDDSTVPLPPSFVSYQPGVSSDITYVLQIDLVRKGLRRHESLCVPVLYLPKSRPDVAPITAIPLPLRPRPDARLKIVNLAPHWRDSQDSARLPSAPLPNISLVIPSPQCFASGDIIPLALSVVCPQAPAIAMLLTSHVGVYLVKRKKLWVNNSMRICVREQLVRQAELYLTRDSLDGTINMKVELKAGEPGQESSWTVDGAAAVEHIIRVLVRPPENMKNLPSFRHEEPVRITTDQFGTLAIELLAMGGVPTPALGLSDVHRNLQAIL